MQVVPMECGGPAAAFAQPNHLAEAIELREQTIFKFSAMNGLRLDSCAFSSTLHRQNVTMLGSICRLAACAAEKICRLAACTTSDATQAIKDETLGIAQT